VMAELALRGYNVSMPEIDIGDDVLVLNHATGQLSRVQVKTATGRRLKTSDRTYRCQFSVRLDHVNDAVTAGAHYVFAARCGAAWRFLVLPKSVLKHLISHSSLGSRLANGNHMITVVSFGPREARSSTRANAADLSPYAGNWDPWPSPS
jgi:hypothetical protein